MQIMNHDLIDPFLSIQRPVERESGYSEREAEVPAPAVPVVEEAVPVVEEVVKKEELPLVNYLMVQFENIVRVSRSHLEATDDRTDLESALAEVEFYKQLVADAKVAWTKAVPSGEVPWDNMIELGTILSRTP